MPTVPAPGTIGWCDLTVPDADSLRGFYEAVTGWRSEPIEMGGYSDFMMMAGDVPVAGVCYARGANASIPPVWLIYVTVPSLSEAIAACLAQGGALVAPARSSGPNGEFAIIRDPAGAVLGIYATV